MRDMTHLKHSVAFVAVLALSLACRGQDAPGPATGPNGDAEALDEMRKLPRASVTAAQAPSGGYTVDAMVGQVNGRAIYAGFVFSEIGEALAGLGRSVPREEFRRQARELIIGRLNQIVLDSLILGEAERDLSEQEQLGLQALVAQQRENLLRRGYGSESLTNEILLEETGRDLEQSLQDYRQRLLVSRYLQQKLFPKINITRKDIERYYTDHPEEFNPPASRTLRLIRVATEADADKVDAMLAQGRPFVEIAESPINRYNPTAKGTLETKATDGKVFGIDALNQAIAPLQQGGHSPRVETPQGFWWVMLEKVEAGQARTLREAQLQIENFLRAQRFRYLTQRYNEERLRNGSYNPLDQMADALLDVAMNRYALPE